MKICLLLLAASALSLLSSCCDTDAYEAQLQTWVSRSESDLLSYWGIPSQTYTIDGSTKLLTFHRSRTQFIQGTPASVTTEKEYKENKTRKTTYYNNGTPDRVVTYSCTTTFTIKNKKVIAWKWNGDDCCG